MEVKKLEARQLDGGIALGTRARETGIRPIFNFKVATYSDGTKTLQLCYKGIVEHDIMNKDGVLVMKAGSVVKQPPFWCGKLATAEDLAVAEHFVISDAIIDIGVYVDPETGQITTAAEPKWQAVYDEDGCEFSLHGKSTFDAYVERKAKEIAAAAQTTASAKSE